MAKAKPSMKMTSPFTHWLFKTEPESFSIDGLADAPKQTTEWSGVRNYQARNFLRDDIKRGQRVLFYHSSANPPAIVGVASVVRGGYADHTAWDETDHHYDAKSTPQNPRWFMVDIQYEERFTHPLPLRELREVAELAGMELLKQGSRLSVQPVTAEHFKIIMKLGRAK